MRVLITQEDASQAQHLAHFLAAEGYEVTSAPDGRQALAMAQRDKPNLVISDALAPGINGYELCAHIKSDQQLADVPVILLTTLSDPQDVIRGLECRADNFVLKPFDSERLIRRIQHLLNRPHHQAGSAGEGLENVFSGQTHVITANRPQILDLLLSTCEAAIQRTRELEQSNEALRQSQHALVQQERLRALGHMASGVAHDINNAISPISLYTEALLDREQLSEKARAYLGNVQRAIDDVAQTVGRLREFYRPREREPKLSDVELNPLVQQVIDLTRNRWKDLAQQRGVTIEVVPTLARNLATIRGTQDEIRDALVNLVCNAVDALPQGGRIEISTRNLAGVQVEVSDTGIGMDEDTRRRCMEPFFTTKGNRGSGLGLATVYGMAKRHGARLEIDSAPGKGTRVRLNFRNEPAQPVGISRRAAPPTATRSLRVLLVDDDPSLLESLRSALQDEGHKVTTASGGQAGIDAFREAQHAGKLFDLVITDLRMPYVDGREVVASVRAMSPGTPIILLTGWGQHAVNEQDLPPQVDRLLGKPPRIRELRTALAELTGRRAADRPGQG
jgi:DNA-binding response OmpR family regulator/anti-sigma regulatory factor (Ser/Thr protein kinase)